MISRDTRSTVGKWAATVAALGLPLLVALHSPISLFAANLEDVAAKDTVRSLLVFGLSALIATLLLSTILHSLAKGALTAGIAVAAFLSYGHVYNLARTATVAGVLVGRHRYLAPLFLGAILLAWFWISRKAGLSRQAVGRLTAIPMAMVLLASYPILRYHVWTEKAGALPPLSAGNPVPGTLPAESRGESLPDIYYIIVDAHGRADTLAAFYGYDSSRFLSDLRREGFFVAESSLSNYSQTALSLGSSLNMGYLDDLAARLGPSSQDRGPARALTTDNAVIQLANRLGYQVVTTENALLWEVFEGADVTLRPDFISSRTEFAVVGSLGLNSFEGLLLETTIGRVWYDYLVQSQHPGQGLTSFEYQKHRERILFQFKELQRLPQMEGPQFVLIHIMAPHAPLVFGEHGEELPNPRSFTLLDGGCCSREDYFGRLPGQVSFIDRMLAQTVSKILAESKEAPIIVIQGDHGPAGYVYAETSPEMGRLDRMAILNAYYLPGTCRSALYPEITPVNTFRLIFGKCLGLAYSLLPDASFFSESESPYQFIPVTNLELE